jgi:hypothetical protein
MSNVYHDTCMSMSNVDTTHVSKCIMYDMMHAWHIRLHCSFEVPSNSSNRNTRRSLKSPRQKSSVSPCTLILQIPRDISVNFRIRSYHQQTSISIVALIHSVAGCHRPRKLHRGLLYCLQARLALIARNWGSGTEDWFRCWNFNRLEAWFALVFLWLHNSCCALGCAYCPHILFACNWTLLCTRISSTSFLCSILNGIRTLWSNLKRSAMLAVNLD